MVKTILLFIFLSAPICMADIKSAVRDDIQLILKTANLPTETLQFDIQAHKGPNTVEIKCLKTPVVGLVVRAAAEEQVSTFYYGLFKLGFLFPHPRQQMSPTLEKLKSHCGKTYTWRPTVRYRGFHLHTQHPSEWVHAFFMGDKKIAREIVLWNARNMQNVLQIQMIRGDLQTYAHYMKDALALAKNLQIRRGLSLSLAMIQQKSYSLLPPWRALVTYGAADELKIQTQKLIDLIDFDFLTLELGSTEFTALHYQATVDWLNTVSQFLRAQRKFLMTKIHVSTNQFHSELGNYNFLPQLAEPSVGVLPHTVMYYQLQDDTAPVYERQNFKDILDFTLSENKRRMTWYYPETSYFIGMDIDVPLFLTDYLKARTEDYKWASDNKIAGHINFSTGQELGYWLFDWQVALQANQENLGNELSAIQLLGEDEPTWKKIIEFQNKYIKGTGLLDVLSSANLLDELQLFGQIHKRNLLFKLFKKPSFLLHDISRLEAALGNLPNIDKVKNEELKIMLAVTHLRIRHALALRRAIHNEKNKLLKKENILAAQNFRAEARLLMNSVKEKYNRYPDAKIFSKHTNPTSYKFGYGYPAAELHFWLREERIVEKKIRNPFFMNIYNPIDILF